MNSEDTVKLLRQCDAGIKMGVSSIEDVLSDVKSPELKKLLADCKDKHEVLKTEMQKLLEEYHDDGKNPNIIAKSMSWMKTNVKMATDNSDSTIADLMTDGCNMGVKSLSRYLNEYSEANERSKDLTRRLITLEESLAKEIRIYL